MMQTDSVHTIRYIPCVTVACGPVITGQYTVRLLRYTCGGSKNRNPRNPPKFTKSNVYYQ